MAFNGGLVRRNGDRLLGDERVGASVAVVEDSEGDLLNLERMDEGIERC